MWLAGRQRFQYFRGVAAEHVLQRFAKYRRLIDVEHTFRRTIHADYTLLLVDHNDRILHILKNRFISKRRKLDDLFDIDHPCINWQHRRENQRHKRNRIGAITQIVSNSRRQRYYTAGDKQVQSTPMPRRYSRTVREQTKYGCADNGVAVWKVDEQEPRTPLPGSRQKLARLVGDRQVPHEFMVNIGRGQCN